MPSTLSITTMWCGYGLATGDIVLFLTPEHSGVATIKNIEEEGVDGFESIYEIENVMLTG